MTNRIVVIVGPTAGGKSELAVALGERFDGEVINADSMQVYRHLDAGTAKPTPDQRRRVMHHLVDVVDPTESWTVADWYDAAEAAIADVQHRHRLPIVVGGTNLYLKALLEGLFDGPPADEAYRASVAGTPAHLLHEQLVAVDPDAAQRIHRNDHKRIVRALEVYRTTGRPISEQQREWDGVKGSGFRVQGSGSQGLEPREPGARHPEPAYRHSPVLIGLRWSTEAINRRINARVKAMFFPEDAGEDLIAETRRLDEAGLLAAQARQALGTKQVLAHLAGEMTADEAFERVKIETRRFAKGQRTWLKRYRGVHWLDADSTELDELIEKAAAVVSRQISP